MLLFSVYDSLSNVTCLINQGGKADPGPPPPDYLDQQWSLHTGVVYDGVPSGRKFGDVNVDAKDSYSLVKFYESYFRLMNVLLLFCYRMRPCQ